MTEQQESYSIGRITTTTGVPITLVEQSPEFITNSYMESYFKMRYQVLKQELRWIERHYPEAVK